MELITGFVSQNAVVAVVVVVVVFDVDVVVCTGASAMELITGFVSQYDLKLEIAGAISAIRS